MSTYYYNAFDNQYISNDPKMSLVPTDTVNGKKRFEIAQFQNLKR